jgi:hypothetical protein
MLTSLFKPKPEHSQSGINMVDLMMWLVIAALIMAAAIQSIGYYQKTAYLYQTKTEVDVVAGRVVAESVIDGESINEDLIAETVAAENAARANDGITVSSGTILAGKRYYYIKAVHEALEDKESLFFFDAFGSYSAGVNVIPAGALDSMTAAPPTGVPTPTPSPTATTLNLRYNWVVSPGAGTGNWRSASVSSNGQYMIAGKFGGMITVSKDGGASWTTQTIPGFSSGVWRAVSVSKNGQVMAAAASDMQHIYTTRDGGTNWVKATAIGGGYWWAISMSDDGTKMIAAEFEMDASPITGLPTIGRIVTSFDSGVTWAEETELGKGKWRSAAISPDGSTLMAGGRDGLGMNVSTDNGATWTRTLVDNDADFTGVDLSDDGESIVAVTQGSSDATAINGKAYHSLDRGKTWTEINLGGDRNYVGATISANGERIIVSARNDYMYASTDAGVTWLKQEVPQNGWLKVELTSDGTSAITMQENAGNVYIGTLISE